MVEIPDAAGPIVTAPSRVGWIALGIGLVALGVGMAALAVSSGPNATRIETLTAQQADANRVALALAANHLRASALSGSPFANELELVRILGRADPEMAAHLAPLELTQKTGVPSIRRLVADFEHIAAQVLIEESTSPDAGWLGQTFGRISAITVALMMEARLNPLKSQVGPAIKKMQVAITEGNFSDALTEIADMPDQSRAAFAPWRDLVQSRSEAIAALNRVTARAAALAPR
jgi:hypothetical protein